MFFFTQSARATTGLVSIAVCGVVLALVSLTSPAGAQSFSGTAGFDPAQPPQTQTQAQPPVAVPPATVPPVFDSVPQVQEQGMVPQAPQHMNTQPAAPMPGMPSPPAFDPRLIQQQHQQPAVPMAPATPAAPGQPMTATPPAAAELPPDPCAAYLSSYEYYAICQDRIQRLERMKEAQEKRAATRDEARQKLEQQRREAEEQRTQQQPRQRRLIRPGQVEPAPPAPRPVQIVEPDSATKK